MRTKPQCIPPLEIAGAGNGARTRDIKLGKLALYQLSYARSLILYVTTILSAEIV